MALKEVWIRNGITEDAIEWADKTAKDLATKDDYNRKEKMSSSQLRRFFGNLKRIQANFEQYKGEIPLLKPKLAYSVGKDYNTKINVFYNEVVDGLNTISKKCTKDEFDRFVALVESIVAFHRYHGGK